MTGSKFSSLRAMRERREQEASADPGPVMAPVEVAAAQTASPRRVGRPPGKRSNPEYQQVTVLLHGQTYVEVRKRLLDERKEVSTLIDELLAEWLKR